MKPISIERSTLRRFSDPGSPGVLVYSPRRPQSSPAAFVAPAKFTGLSGPAQYMLYTVVCARGSWGERLVQPLAAAYRQCDRAARARVARARAGPIGPCTRVREASLVPAGGDVCGLPAAPESQSVALPPRDRVAPHTRHSTGRPAPMPRPTKPALGSPRFPCRCQCTARSATCPQSCRIR